MTSYNLSTYRDKLRILLILYFFSENYFDNEHSNRIKVFQSEVKIQKIDFLIRYPDYLSYELIEKAKTDSSVNRDEIKNIIKEIFLTKEPEVRREEMLKFLYGAWEEIDDIILFLKALNLINFECKKNIAGRPYDKTYYITTEGKNIIENRIIPNLKAAQWYINRCLLIKRFFGDMRGTELKISQYKHQEYRETSLGSYISAITDKVKEYYFNEFGEAL